MTDPDMFPLSRAFLEYREADTVLEAFVAHAPDYRGRLPCVLVGHDWSGPNAAIRAITERIARLGYLGFALDVYGKGARGDELGDNSALMGPLLADRALLRRRLLAGLAAAQAHPRADPDRAAVVGYCFGGTCALDLARAAPPGLRGTVSVHGGLGPPRLGPQGPIPSAILVLHGWEDPIVPQEDLLAITRELTAAGADWQVHAYGHAMHAFTFQAANMPERGIAHDEKADRRAWKAMTDFLAEVLT